MQIHYCRRCKNYLTRWKISYGRIKAIWVNPDGTFIAHATMYRGSRISMCGLVRNGDHWRLVDGPGTDSSTSDEAPKPAPAKPKPKAKRLEYNDPAPPAPFIGTGKMKCAVCRKPLVEHRLDRICQGVT